MSRSLGRFAARGRLVAVIGAGLRLVGAAGLVAAAGSLAGVPPGVVAAALAAVLAWIAARHVAGPLFDLAHPARVARMVEDGAPECRGVLVSGVELEDALLRGPLEPAGLSSGLAREHVKSALASCGPVRTRRVVRARVLRRPLAWAVAGLLAAGAALAFWPSRLGRLASGLTAPASSSGAGGHAPGAVMLGDIKLTIRPPEYTRLPPRTLANASGDITALKGSRVDFEALTDRDVKSAAVECPGVGRLPFETPSRNRVSGSFTVVEEGPYRFVFESAGGSTLPSSREFMITLEQDRFPGIDITQPISDRAVKESEKIEIAYRADDDFGVKQVKIEILRSDGTETRDVRIWDPPTTASADRLKLDIGALRPEPDERIGVTLAAYDNDVVSGPKRSASRTIFLTILGLHDPLAQALPLQERLLNDLIHLLADHLLHPVLEGGKPDPEVDRAERSMQERLSTLSQDLEGIAAILRDLPEGEAYFRDSMESLKKGIDEHLAFRRGVFREEVAPASPVLLTGRARERLTDAALQGTVLLEDDVLFVDSLIGKARMESVISELQALRKLQRELASALQEYARSPSSAGLAAIEKLLRDIKRRMESARHSMARLPSEIPREFLNVDSLPNADLSSMDGMLDSIREKLYQGNPADALASADQALKQLDGLLGALENSADQYAGALDTRSQKALARLHGELGRLEKRQEALHEETGGLEGDVLERLSGERPGRGAESILKNEIALGRRMEEKIASALQQARRERFEPEPGTGFDSPSTLESVLDEAGRSAHAATESLEGQELQQALRHTGEVGDRLSLSSRLRTRGDRPGDDAVSRDLNEARQAQEALMDDLKTLESLLEGGGPPSLDPAERRRVEKLAAGQKSLRDGLSRATRGFSEQSETDPSAGEIRRQLEGAGESMQGAEEGLRGSRVSSARLHQKDALERLKDLRESLEAGEGEDGGGAPRMLGRPGTRAWRSEPRPSGSDSNSGMADMKGIEVPRGATPADLEALRRELTDAMKEKSPEGFESLVMRYYRRLIEK